MEIWKKTRYRNLEISNLGKVKRNGQIVKPYDQGIGYLQVTIGVNGKRKHLYVHRLVAKAFIDNPKKKKEVNHKDFNKKNNHVENLEWLTKKENMKHAFINGRIIFPPINTSSNRGYRKPKPKKQMKCLRCGSLTFNKKFCSNKCSLFFQRKVDRPSMIDLLVDIRTMSTLAVGRKYGVSDAAVKKWAKSYGIWKPRRPHV